MLRFLYYFRFPPPPPFPLEDLAHFPGRELPFPPDDLLADEKPGGSVDFIRLTENPLMSLALFLSFSFAIRLGMPPCPYFLSFPFRLSLFSAGLDALFSP